MLLRHDYTVVLLAFFLLVTVFPGLGFCCGAAQPDKAVFYPDEAQLSVGEEKEVISLPSGRKAIIIALPNGALRDSFMLSINGVPAQGYYWPEKEEKEEILALCRKEPVPSFAELPENETSAERKELLGKLLPLSEQVARIEGELQATQIRLNLLNKSYENFGSNRGENISPAEEASKLSKVYAEEYPKLQKDFQTQQRSLMDAKNLMEKEQKKLADFDRRNNSDIVVIPHPEAGRQKLRYDYVLPASCAISYRLDARPDKSEFSVNQDVALYQNSGMAWKNVDLYVSTVRRDKTLRPGNMRGWTIRLEDKVKRQQPKMDMVMMEAPAAAPMAQLALPKESKSYDAKVQRPQLEDRGTYRLWSLGRQNLSYGAPVTLSLASDVYQAKFRYTLRPVNSPKGFLTADVNLDKAIELPPGLAQFSVDGAVMGKEYFSFNGDSGVIFFGSDPQVTATMKDLKKTSGEKGFFSKEQTRSWHWLITVKSTRSKPVEVMLEDPAPVTVEESINIITQSTPRPEEIVNEPKDGGARIYRWNMTLQPGEAKEVNHQIQLVAPIVPDKEIIPGR